MDRPISVLRQRATSFNPKAATFSPGSSSLTPHHTELGSPTTRRKSKPTLPQRSFETNASPSGSLSISGSPGSDHVDVRDTRATYAPDPGQVRATEAAANSPSSLPPFTFSAQHPRPSYTMVGLNELSTGLGLPAAKAETDDVVSPSASHKSQTSQARPGELYGELIGWALDKPLTAKGLAEFLQNQELAIPPAPPAFAPVSPSKAFAHQNVEVNRPQHDVESNQKAETPTRHRVDVPVPNEAISIPMGPSTFQHQHRRSSASSASYRHHERVPSSRRFSRRASRAKRIDQGPMPSVADIYPDDAHWTPPAPIHEAHRKTSCYPKPAEPSKLVVDNVFNWPPPAQVYRPEPAPTAADFDAADIEVLALMNELPEPSLDTLAKLGNSYDLRISTALDLSCDQRCLTPAQEDGSRYGMRFYGLAYGDQWELLMTGNYENIKPFRVRPRDHGGWGGREWAAMKGWVV
ncbi:hypothetical protein C7974DRAFT_376786 [Boeremia exigua]|uniref:uncharacterized protein n=1 Tax=Boeremia exigua TaxID=749465 RepID=UPI001E8EBC15|nr:uncharacterized protein C7974DRAFT_376786 [Boeremia exigua]KAH6625243.1 hypothetical protein C7974DRAFT_376786 [Boeremia exigua]